MVCELGGESVDVVVVIRLDRLRDPLVQLRTPRGTEPVEQDFAHERMVEPQHRTVGRRLDEHTRPPHHLDRRQQIRLGETAGPGDDAELDRAADDCADLEHTPRGRAEPGHVRVDQLGEPARQPDRVEQRSVDGATAAPQPRDDDRPRARTAGFPRWHRAPPTRASNRVRPRRALPGQRRDIRQRQTRQPGRRRRGPSSAGAQAWRPRRTRPRHRCEPWRSPAPARRAPRAAPTRGRCPCRPTARRRPPAPACGSRRSGPPRRRWRRTGPCVVVGSRVRRRRASRVGRRRRRRGGRSARRHPP